jgi:hypothetical protein
MIREEVERAGVTVERNYSELGRLKEDKRRTKGRGWWLLW